MLKAYHEKPKPKLVILNNKLGLENPMHSESCVGLEAEKEEDTESEVRLGNDEQPLQLQYSQIFNDLGTKLSHLPLVQRTSSTCILVPKHDGGFHFCTALSMIKQSLIHFPYPELQTA